jgi:acetyl-CoA C-acetyltransferase
MSEAWIIDGVRSPRGRGKDTGALHTIHPQELLGQVLNALRDRVGFDPAEVDDVVCGNVSGTADHGMVIGRMAILAAGWPVETPGTTVNRFCGSGQQAVTIAAMGVIAGHQDLVIGSGVEMMSRWERERAPDFAAGNAKLRAMYPMVPQGVSADLIATLEGFSREDCDAFAVESQRRTEIAQLEGRFDKSIVPISEPNGGGIVLDRDEHPRPGTDLGALSSLEPSFAQLGQAVSSPHFSQPFDAICLQIYPKLAGIDHVHHAGNSSGVVDGASAVLVASSDYAKAHGLQGRARVVMSSVMGAEPVIMLTAPGPASVKCLERAKMTKDDIDLWEINEAFASVPLKVTKDLDLDPMKVNVNGGAIALGHPIGATGPMLIQTALDELERTDKTTALITMCTGGGMATASIIERI